MITISAPAKVNLYLHITGRRNDGYHLLDSLFAFTQLSDVITITPADQLSLTIEGPYASALSQEALSQNLVFRAAQRLAAIAGVKTGAAIHLQKNLPVGAGLGGGSSDAAATLKGLAQLWQLSLDTLPLTEIAVSLGADVPACLYAKPALITGIGEVVDPVFLPFSSTPIVLINPTIPLSTPAVFRQFKENKHPFSQQNPPFSEAELNDFSVFQTILSRYKNDMESPAFALESTIEPLLAQLKTMSGAWLSRMSGSGPTCFALFHTKAAATEAVNILTDRFPTYWIQQSLLHWQ